MQTLTNYTGVDISRSFFDVAVPLDGRYHHHQFSNDQKGYDAFLKVLPAGVAVSMEASGPYYLRLACYLHSKEIRVSVINPLVIRRFTQMRMSRTKTDKKDARMIAEYSVMTHPEQWGPPKQHVIALQQMEAYVSGLTKRYTALSNQLDSFGCSGALTRDLKKAMEKELSGIQLLIDQISNKMQQIVETHYNEMLTDLKTIPGIGNKTAMMLIVLSGGFERFQHSGQLSSYIGLCPRIFESGSSIKGRGGICKMGMSAIRSALYVCAWSAKRCNKACRELYERLTAKGKAKKLALVAVANKLLKQTFAIAKQTRKYDENYSRIICF